jgi:hypothetical protein
VSLGGPQSQVLERTVACPRNPRILSSLAIALPVELTSGKLGLNAQYITT